jgi:hypothetical protein
MKPFARIADVHGEDRNAPADRAKAAHMERRWCTKDGKLECRYVMVRSS